MSGRPRALIVDDGELRLPRVLLSQIGVPFSHLCPSELRPPMPSVESLMITTARLAIANHLWRQRPKAGEPPTWIAVVPTDSKTQRKILRAAGFDYLVPEHVHPSALKLLLQQALYAGENTQRVMRAPYGGKVSLVGRLLRRRAVLVDISRRGCRLLSEKPPRVGSGVTVQIPNGGPRPLKVEGTVVWSAPAERAGGRPGETAIGVRFARMDGAQRERIKALVVERMNGPKAFDDSGALRSLLPDVPESNRADEPQPDSSWADYGQRVDAFCTGTTRVLVGRDLCDSGMRVADGSQLEMGERLRLALPVAPREEPLLIEAHVARDKQGLVILFDWVDPASKTRLRELIKRLPKIRHLKDETPTQTVVPIGVVGWKDGD